MVQNLKKFKLSKGFYGRPAWIAQLWWIIQAMLFNPSPQFMFSWRRFLLRLFGAKIGKSVLIRSSVHISYPWNLTIGDYSWIGDDVTLYNVDKIEIADNVVISQKSYICTATHDYLKEDFPTLKNKIVIESEAWVASDVFISPGVTIGSTAVIGTRSLVLEDMPSGMICLGHPAKPIKPRKE